MSVRKQTGPQRVHSSTHMYEMRTYSFLFVKHVQVLRMKDYIEEQILAVI